jgi:putative ABC transport system permease protein
LAAPADVEHPLPVAPDVQTILQDIRVATRSLAVRPSFSTIAILTLALGIGATTALFSVVHGVLLRPLPYHEADRVIALWQTSSDNPGPSVGGSVSHVNYLDWKSDAHSFESMALFSGANYIISGQEEAELVRGGIVTPDFFKVFGATPVIGREFTRDEDRPNGPRVVILSHAFWKDRLGGRSDVLGSSIEISGRNWDIVGVAPQGFAYPMNAKLWTPVQNDDEGCGRGCVYLNGIARLAPGVTLDSARQEMLSIAQRLEKDYPDSNTNLTIGLARLQDQIVGDVRPALLMLFGAVIMVLLIACANVANLVLVRGSARQSEIAVRTALGAGRQRLIQFLLMESLVLALAGAALGLLLAWWGVDVLKQLAPADMPRLSDVGFNLTTFAFALASGTLTTLLFGLGPALQVLRAPLSSLLTVRADTGSGRTRWTRSALLVAEVALSLMLLVGAGLLLRSVHQLQAIEPGWKSEGITIFTIGLPSARYPKPPDAVRAFEELDVRLSAVPGVEMVGRINGIPLGPSENVLSFTRTDRADPGPGQVPSALYRTVDAEYFRTAGIRLLAGRPFDTRDRADQQPTVVISREMADEFWRGEDPIGKVIQIDSTRRTIVGVVAGVRSSNIALPPQPEMYVPHTQTTSRSATFLVRSSQSPAQVLAAAREVVRSLDARLPLIQPGTFAALEDAALARPRFNLLLLSLFAILAVALAAIGIYGVVAYVVTQRTREIGVRMALGARTSAVIRLVVWQGLRPALVGVALGLAGAVASRRLIAGLLYEVRPVDPLTIGAVVVLLAVVVVVACLVPARRATRIPPATALRSE